MMNIDLDLTQFLFRFSFLTVGPRKV